MGTTTGKLLSKLFDKNPVRILVIGLDAAGKTTMLYKMKLGEVATTIPTIGMNVESVEYKSLKITTFDVGGREKIRPLWRFYYRETDALVFMVDNNDRERLGEVKDELHITLSEEDLQDCTFLVMANKQDLPNVMNVDELAEKLDLHKFRNRKWYIQPTTVTSGEGIFEGFDWLSSTIAQNKAKENARVFQQNATNTVTDNKTIVTGWKQALLWVQTMRDWTWGQMSDQ